MRVDSLNIFANTRSECDFYTLKVILTTYECDYDTQTCDYDTHEFYLETYNAACKFKTIQLKLKNLVGVLTSGYTISTSFIWHVVCGLYAHASNFDTYIKT
jgi:hypothetical protein